MQPRLTHDGFSMIADVLDLDRGVGWGYAVDGPIDFVLSRNDRAWIVFESSADRVKGEGIKLSDALSQFAVSAGITGRLKICWDLPGEIERVDLPPLQERELA